MSIDGNVAGDGAADEFPLDARLWVRVLSQFIVNHQPTDKEVEEAVPYGVQSARNQAIMAAYERIERLCRADEGRARSPVYPIADFLEPLEN